MLKLVLFIIIYIFTSWYLTKALLPPQWQSTQIADMLCKSMDLHYWESKLTDICVLPKIKII